MIGSHHYCTWRTLVVWSPSIVLLLNSPIFSVLSFNSLSWSVFLCALYNFLVTSEISACCVEWTLNLWVIASLFEFVLIRGVLSPLLSPDEQSLLASQNHCGLPCAYRFYRLRRTLSRILEGLAGGCFHCIYRLITLDDRGHLQVNPTSFSNTLWIWHDQLQIGQGLDHVPARIFYLSSRHIRPWHSYFSRIFLSRSFTAGCIYLPFVDTHLVLLDLGVFTEISGIGGECLRFSCLLLTGWTVCHLRFDNRFAIIWWLFWYSAVLLVLFIAVLGS